MLIAGIALGLVLGLLVGGSIANLATVRLRWIALLFAAVVVRFTTEAALGSDLAFAEALRLPLLALSYTMLLVGLYANRALPGMSLAFVGVLGNTLAIVANGGYMPIWEPSLAAAGFSPADVPLAFHVILPPELSPEFFLHAGPLGDVIPIPLPIVQNVASIGDVFLAAGLAFFLFATVVRTPQELDAEAEAAIRHRLVELLPESRHGIAVGLAAGRLRTQSGLATGIAHAFRQSPDSLGDTADDRSAEPLPGPTAFASAAAGGAGGAAAAFPTDGIAIPLPRPRLAERARRHPYVRLALNGSFTALWTGQLISLFGDRIHQIALAFLVYGATESAVAVGLVFVAATLPNLLFSPIAGTFVDRWEHKEVLVVSDLLRAATVLLVPVAAGVNLILVYPLIFATTTISIFFRPARVAILPRIVSKDDLLPANSAMWVGETMADVIGYPLAGLFVAFLGAALPLAFWLDGATYVASAILLASIVVPSLSRAVAATDAGAPRRGFFYELGEGWGFLRNEATLLANTVQATVAQFTVGILIALTPIYASEVIRDAPFGPEAVYSFLETGIGLGNLVGGFILGLVGARFARGKTVIVGYTLWGLATAGLALTGNLAVAIGLMFGSGIANMIFVIPSQTLFQERTPEELMGRVIGFRFALVFGSMTLAMGAGGILGQIFGVEPVLGVFGMLTAIAGIAGLFVPAVRDA